MRGWIEGLDNPGATLLSLRLSGLLFADDQRELALIQELITARFLFGRMDHTTLRPAPSDFRWIGNLPEGVLRDTAARLRELADPAFRDRRPEGATPEVAAQALIELYGLGAEVSA